MEVCDEAWAYTTNGVPDGMRQEIAHARSIGKSMIEFTEVPMPEYIKEINGFLVDADTGQYLEFQFNSNYLSDEKATAYAAIRIPGMSHPRYQYIAGEPRKIAFKVELWKGDVKGRVDWLRSLLYPEHAGTMLRNAPHRVLLFFGDLFPGVLCIVREVKVKYFHL